MRKTSHSIGDIVYLNGKRGMVKGINPNGTAIVHSTDNGQLLGTAPAYVDMKRLPSKIQLKDIEDEQGTYSVVKDDYMDRDFDSPSLATTEWQKESAAKRMLKYWKDYQESLAAGDAGYAAESLQAFEYEAVVSGADKELIKDNKCGLEGCQYIYGEGGFGPNHYASSGCKSGRRNHCTCDTCF